MLTTLKNVFPFLKGYQPQFTNEIFGKSSISTKKTGNIYHQKSQKRNSLRQTFYKEELKKYSDKR